MDTLRSALFYFFAAVMIAGALLAALAPSRRLRAVGVGLTGVGLAALCADLSAGFTGLICLISYMTMASLLAGRATINGAREAVAGRVQHLGALAAALLFVALAYAAFRGAFHSAGYPGGEFGAAAVGRLLLGREALAVEALVALLSAGLITLLIRTRSRRR